MLTFLFDRERRAHYYSSFTWFSAILLTEYLITFIPNLTYAVVSVADKSLMESSLTPWTGDVFRDRIRVDSAAIRRVLGAQSVDDHVLPGTQLYVCGTFTMQNNSDHIDSTCALSSSSEFANNLVILPLFFCMIFSGFVCVACGAVSRTRVDAAQLVMPANIQKWLYWGRASAAGLRSVV